LLVLGEEPTAERIAGVLLEIRHVIVLASYLETVFAGNDAVCVAEFRTGLVADFIKTASPGERREKVGHTQTVDTGFWKAARSLGNLSTRGCDVIPAAKAGKLKPEIIHAIRTY